MADKSDVMRPASALSCDMLKSHHACSTAEAKACAAVASTARMRIDLSPSSGKVSDDARNPLPTMGEVWIAAKGTRPIAPPTTSMPSRVSEIDLGSRPSGSRRKARIGLARRCICPNDRQLRLLGPLRLCVEKASRP